MGKLTDLINQIIASEAAEKAEEEAAKKAGKNPKPDPATEPEKYVEYYNRKQRMDFQWKKVIRLFAQNPKLFDTPEFDKSLKESKAEANIKKSLITTAVKRAAGSYIAEFRPDLIADLSEHDKLRFPKSDKLIDQKLQEINKKGKLTKNDKLAMERRSIFNSLAMIDKKDFLKVAVQLEKNLPKETIDQMEQILDEGKFCLDLEENEIYEKTHQNRVDELKQQTLEEIKNDPEKLEKYNHALDFAANHLTMANTELRSYYKSMENSVYQPISSASIKKYVKDFQNENKNNADHAKYQITESFHTTGGMYNVVPAEKKEQFESVINEKLQLSDKTKDGMRRVFEKLDEMNVSAYSDSGVESGSKEYGFKKLLVEKQELTKALEEGNPDKIIEASSKFEKTWKDLEEIYQICKETMGSDPNVFPGNMDSVRHDGVNFEFAKDLNTTAQFNTLYNTYIELKRGGKTYEEYLENSSGILLESAENTCKEYSINEAVKGKSFDETLQCLFWKGEYMKKNDTADRIISTTAFAVNRNIDGPAYLESDPKLRGSNFNITEQAKSYATQMAENEGAKYRYFRGMPITPQERQLRAKTIGNLLICKDEDRNMNNIYADFPETNAFGLQIGESFDSGKYLQEKPVNYEEIMERASKFETAAEKWGKNFLTKEDVIAAKASAYIQVLNVTAKNSADPAYQKMEQELLAIPSTLSANHPSYADVVNQINQYQTAKQLANEAPAKEENIINNENIAVPDNAPDRKPLGFAEEYTRLRSTKINLKENEVKDPASNPEKYISDSVESRKTNRAISHMNEVIKYLGININQLLPVLNEVIGVEKTQKYLEGRVKGSKFKSILRDIAEANHPDLLNLLPDDKKEAYQNGYDDNKGEILDELINEKKILPRKSYEEALAHSAIIGLDGLTPEDEFKIIKGLEANLTEQQKKAFDEKMSSFVDPLDLPEEKQYDFPYQEKVNSLKETMPEEIKNDPEKKSQYEHALDVANNVLSDVKEEIRYDKKETETTVMQHLEAIITNKIYAENEAKFKDGKYHDIYEEHPLYGGNLRVAKPGREKDLSDLRNEKITLSDKTKEAFRQVFKKMDEMHILDYPYEPSGESPDKSYGFNKLLAEKEELRKAMEEGNPDKIIEASGKLEKTWKDYEELYHICKTNLSPDETHYPGNMDSVRNGKINYVFSGDLKTTAQLNTLFGIYVVCHRSGKTVDEYMENPTGTAIDSVIEGYEPVSFENVSKNLNFQESLDLMLQGGKFRSGYTPVLQAVPTWGVARAIAGPSLLESDPEIKTGNIVISQNIGNIFDHILDGQTTKYAYLGHNAKTEVDKQSKDLTVQNLLICSDEDRNLNAMLGGLPETDILGNRISDGFNADEYMKSKPVDYEGVLRRAGQMEKAVDDYEKRFPRDRYIQVADVVKNEIILYSKILNQATLEERKTNPHLQKMQEDILNSASRLPENSDPEKIAEVKAAADQYRFAERPELKASELVDKANAAKVGVHLGSKQFDEAIKAMGDVQKSLAELQELRGKGYEAQKDKIDEVRQKIEIANEKIDLYFDRKRKQNKMGDKADEKSKRRIAVMQESKEGLKQFSKTVNEFDIQAEMKAAADLNKEMANQDNAALQNQILGLNERAAAANGIEKRTLNNTVGALDQLYMIQNAKDAKKPLSEQEKAEAVHAIAKCTFQEMMDSVHGQGIRAKMNDNEYSYKQQVEKVLKSEEFQKALPKDLNREKIREFTANPNSAKRILTKMEKEISKKAEIDKNKNLENGVQRGRSKSVHIKGNKPEEQPKLPNQ